MKKALKVVLPLVVGVSVMASAEASIPCSGHESYYSFTPVTNGTKISVKLQGIGSTKLPNKTFPVVSQFMELTDDCKFNSVIYASLGPGDPIPVFTLTGSWSYPAQSKLIYFTIDGDISAGEASTGTWGTLFGSGISISNFIPLLLTPVKDGVAGAPKVDSPLQLIYPSVSQQKGYISINSNGQATITTLIGGKTIATKLPSNVSKEAAFSFGATTKATVSTVPAP